MTALILGGRPQEEIETIATRKQTAVDKLTELFKEIEENGLELMTGGHATIISHPGDFQINPMLHAELQSMTFNFGYEIDKIGTCQLVLYRLATSHTVAFAGHTRNIRKMEGVDVYVTVRPLRFVNDTVPDEIQIEQLDEAMQPVDQLIVLLERLLAGESLEAIAASQEPAQANPSASPDAEPGNTDQAPA